MTAFPNRLFSSLFYSFVVSFSVVHIFLLKVQSMLLSVAILDFTGYAMTSGAGYSNVYVEDNITTSDLNMSLHLLLVCLRTNVHLLNLGYIGWLIKKTILTSARLCV